MAGLMAAGLIKAFRPECARLPQLDGWPETGLMAGVRARCSPIAAQTPEVHTHGGGLAYTCTGLRPGDGVPKPCIKAASPRHAFASRNPDTFRLLSVCLLSVPHPARESRTHHHPRSTNRGMTL